MLLSLHLPLLMHFADSCYNTFLGFHSWNAYLNMSGPNCDVKDFPVLGAHSGILLIALAILDDLFQAAGLAAVLIIMFLGVQLVTADGDPNQMAKTQEGIVNAVIGLAIVIFATVTVRFIGLQLGTGHGGNLAGIIDLSFLPNPASATSNDFVQAAFGLAFAVLGAFALLMVVVGGFQYTASQGDPQGTAKAKNKILYALIGLVLVVVARSIVSFVVIRVTA